ncbi:hypothetical protein [Deinococcus koreensis]|uniref:Uncharacterized protein n=1 Tax=Deinococcus koreensis TaxID=2054903 RepID=A0A2K3UVF3_9DEIO|nr:hypothetical protein [Deinococcus koreensis]PNY80515.1 hypothetical protein CVO96_03285 [Deinococcus koreensis]
MTFLRHQAAWLLLGLLLSGVWWLMTHTGGAAPAPSTPATTSAALSLSTPARLTLNSGEVVGGVISGAQALCPSWNAQLAAGDLTITLPDGRSLRGGDVRAIDAAPATLGGLAELVNTTACGDTLTLHTP